MEIIRETRDLIEFPADGFGRFHAVLHNADIVELKFMANGDEAKGVLKATDRKFLETVHKHLGSLLTFLEKGNGTFTAPTGKAPVQEEIET